MQHLKLNLTTSQMSTYIKTLNIVILSWLLVFFFMHNIYKKLKNKKQKNQESNCWLIFAFFFFYSKEDPESIFSATLVQWLLFLWHVVISLTFLRGIRLFVFAVFSTAISNSPALEKRYYLCNAIQATVLLEFFTLCCVSYFLLSSHNNPAVRHNNIQIPSGLQFSNIK